MADLPREVIERHLQWLASLPQCCFPHALLPSRILGENHISIRLMANRFSIRARVYLEDVDISLDCFEAFAGEKGWALIWLRKGGKRLTLVRCSESRDGRHAAFERVNGNVRIVELQIRPLGAERIDKFLAEKGNA